MNIKIGHILALGAVAGAYYLGRQSGIKDQKAADAAGTNLLGQPTQTPGAIAGTTAIPGTDFLKNNLGTGA